MKKKDALRESLKGKHLFIDHSGWYICSSDGREFRKDEITELDLSLKLLHHSTTTGRSTYYVR